jgi:magnesium transporter
VRVAEGLRWTDLIDPTEDELRAALPDGLHPTALATLRAPPLHDDEPRPRIDSHGDYVVGVLLVPVAVGDEDRVYYQEVDFLLTPEHFVTVSKTPPGEEPFDPISAKNACRPDDPTGMYLYRLVDEVAERFLDLVDSLDDEVDELEDAVEQWNPTAIRDRISRLRHDLLHVRRTLAPTRDAVRQIIDNRIEIDGDEELFPRDVELHFADAYDKLLRASEGLDATRELVAGVRDYFQAKVSIDQNEVMKRLTMIASLLLLPTFIVGLYGQNFRKIPELHWGFGYAWSWGLIIVTTIGQLVFFRRKGWF